MTIIKADILAAINAALNTAYATTEADVAIQMTLDDLSRMHCLKAEDVSQSLTSSSTTLNYPTAALDTEQAIISVVLTGANGALPPLRTIPGGWYEYLRLMESFSSSSRGEPKWMVCHERKIYLYPAPDGNYTTSIWSYNIHQALASGVQFTDPWRNAVYFGSIYHVALLKGWERYVAIWGPQYGNERERMRRYIPRDTMIVNS